MRFSQDFIDRVKDSNNLVDIIAQYSQLKPMGQGFMGRCPFPDHPEKTASFSVSESKQLYHCFGCKKSGNIFKFLQEYNGMSFTEAIEYLADRAHIPLPQYDEGKMEQEDLVAKKKKQIITANRLAMEHFQNNLAKLASDHPLRAYLEKRGLHQELIDIFQLGYATEDWDGLGRYLESKGVAMNLADEARLVKPRKEGKSGYFDLFRDRLMFPITSSLGEPLAFGGRIVQQGEPKYLNSPETPVFHKGRVLYGLAQTAKFIRAADQLIVVEGYMDLITLFGAGICQVTASMGTALTPDHAKSIARLTKNVVVLFDGDSAGQDAAERSLPILLNAGLFPKGLILPDGLDPDDFIRERGVDKLLELIGNATDLFVVILAKLMEGYRGDPSEKVILTDKLRPIFSSMADLRLKDLYLQIVCERMGVAKHWLVQALQSGAKTYQNTPQPIAQNSQARPQNQASTNISGNANIIAKDGPKISVTETSEKNITLTGATNIELNLLGLVLKNRANFDAFLESNILEQISHKGVQDLLTKCSDYYRQEPEKFDKFVSLFSTMVDKPDILFAATLENQLQSFSEGDDSSNDESKLLQDCMKKIREHFIKKQSAQLANNFKNKSIDSENQNEALQKIMELHRSRLSINPKNEN